MHNVHDNSGISTVNLGFDPEEIGTKLKFGTELLWVVPNRPKSLFHEKTVQKTSLKSSF